ncbi:peptidoglycan-binding protein [Candidatus Nomurabacteria bacterium]|nr:peptidoglycan-binding protein [Candidatus Nomurabacteria bacterium]
MIDYLRQFSILRVSFALFLVFLLTIVPIPFPLLFNSSVEAATCTYTNGNTNNSWNDADNWDCAHVPGVGANVGDVAVLDNGVSNDDITIDVDVNVNSIVASNGYSGEITQGSGINVTVQTIDFSSGASGANYYATTGSLTVTDTLNVQGFGGFDAGSLTINFTGASNFQSVTNDSVYIDLTDANVFITDASSFVWSYSFTEEGHFIKNLTIQDTTNDGSSTDVSFYNQSDPEPNEIRITGALSVNGLDSNDRVGLHSYTTGITSTITFQSVATFSSSGYLTITDNTVTDASSNITLPLNPSNSTDGGNNVGWFPDASPGVTLSGSSFSITEGNTDTFTVVLDAQPTTDVVLNISSSDTGAVTVSDSTLTFTNANWDSAQTVTLTAVADNDIDNESVTVTVSVDDASSDDDYDAVADGTVSVSVTDDDTAGITVSSGTVAVTEGNSNTFTIVLDSQPATDVVLNISSSDTGAVTVSPSSLTFTNANWDSAQTITFSGVSDADTSDESVTITISVDDASSDDDYDAVSDVEVTANVTDDDTPDVTAPTLSTATVDGTSITLTYNESLNTSSVPDGGDFVILADGSSVSISSISISSNIVTVTLSSSVTSGQTVTISYTAGTNKIKDLAGNNASNLSDQAVTNNTSEVEESNNSQGSSGGGSRSRNKKETNINTGSDSNSTTTESGNFGDAQSITPSNTSFDRTSSLADNYLYPEINFRPVDIQNAASGAFCPLFNEYLKLGSVGQSVEVLQVFLKKQGLLNADANGIFDERTEEAVKAFQSIHSAKILTPWSLKDPTGYWYQSSVFTGNEVVGCRAECIVIDNGQTICSNLPMSFNYDILNSDFSYNNIENILTAPMSFNTLACQIVPIDNTSFIVLK